MKNINIANGLVHMQVTQEHIDKAMKEVSQIHKRVGTTYCSSCLLAVALADSFEISDERRLAKVSDCEVTHEAFFLNNLEFKAPEAMQKLVQLFDDSRDITPIRPQTVFIGYEQKFRDAGLIQ